ncbi:hypothetical protein [Vibrio spartinae]|uniref:Uncharacterized protein n=1 Tax=Vibrio spartinae TaxID=1918945 RepID=A0A1N6M7W5_9VIBR|nr:hypothetical protein [Vibrio spartinae]QMV12833.1 hypothetical protein Vspart_00025 [Vibrio spartinae]SIO95541.1 hypothetical protein VSP9026_03288 [Vibrio spartinae]
MSRSKKWGIRFVIFCVIFLTMKMAFEVWLVPDYRDGKAYVNYSPNREYKAMYVFPKEPSNHIPLLIVKMVDQSVSAIILLPKDWVSTGLDFIWECDDTKLPSCTSYRDAPKVSLPPSLWQRLHAWLTVKLKHLEQPHLKEVHRD